MKVYPVPYGDSRLLLPLDTLGFRPHMTLSLDSPWEEQTCSLTRKEVARYLTLMLFGLTQIGSNKSHLHKIYDAPDIVGRVYKMFVLGAPDESLMPIYARHLIFSLMSRRYVKLLTY